MSKVNKKHTEALVITMEECGELTQACSKIIRNGSHQDRIDALIEEAGDVLCMLKVLKSCGLFKWKDIKKRAKFKRKKFRYLEK